MSYSLDEVSEMLGISHGSLYPFMQSGELEYTQIGGRRFVTNKQLRAFLGRCAVRPSSGSTDYDGGGLAFLN